MLRAFAIAASCLLFAGANVSIAEDSAEARDLSVQQMTAYKAGSNKGSLKVSAWVDRKDLTYVVGEPVKLYIRANEDAHVTVYNVGPKGQVTQIFPNKFQEDNKIKANTAIEIPGSKAQIKVSGPVGAELIKIVATSKPHKVVTGSAESSEVFVVVQGGVADFVRNLEVTATEPAADKLATHNLVIKSVASR